LLDEEDIKLECCCEKEAWVIVDICFFGAAGIFNWHFLGLDLDGLGVFADFLVDLKSPVVPVGNLLDF